MADICFIFPGQGAQKTGMGKSLFDAEPVVQEMYNQADEILGRKISTISFEGEAEELNKTINSQVALLLSSLSSLEVFKKEYPDVEPKLYGGLSLGEYSAQVAANVISFEDALKVVQKRSELMQQACEEQAGGMASIIGLSLDKLSPICQNVDGYMAIANLNCPGQIVVSGDKSVIKDVCTQAKEAGAKLCIELKVAGAFHSKHMQTAADQFKEFLKTVSIDKRNLTKVLSNVSGDVYDNDMDWIQSMTDQIVSPVRWEDNIKTAINMGVSQFVELGTGKTLTGMLKRIDRKAKCVNLDTIEDIKNIQL